MPSFTSAVQLERLPEAAADLNPTSTPASKASPSAVPPASAVFSAMVDEEWSVNGTPHGGYLLSLVIKALNELQEGSGQTDPANIMASFYRAARPGPLTIQASVAKKGRRWTNLDCRLVQSGETLVVVQALYTKFPAIPSTSAPFTTGNHNLLPLTDLVHAPISPFLTHPSKCSLKKEAVPIEVARRWSVPSVLWFSENNMWKPDEEGSMRWSEDLGIKAKREGTGKEEKLELEWGAWCEFVKPEDTITNVCLGFFSDIMSSIPELLPPPHRITPHYYPTLTMSITFHAPLPLPAPYLVAPQTVGCYSYGKNIHEGRHEQLVEVWTAPSAIGQGEEQDNWRKRSMLLATSTQVALSVDVSTMKTGIKRGKAAQPKL